MNRLKMPSLQASRIERWLGKEGLQSLLDNSKDFYVPIPVVNIPGKDVCAYRGDLYGTIEGGGFTSLSDLVSEMTNGKRQDWLFNKAGSLNVNPSFASLWNVGNFPAAGGTVTAIPGGAVPTNSTTGAIPFSNAAGGDTLHLTTLYSQATAAPNTLLLYDRLFHAGSVLHTTTGNQAVSGTPNRYSTTTSPGNFMFLEVTGTLGSTAHNITVTYKDQADNTAETASAITAVASAAVTRIPHSPWFIPLNAGDTGLRSITNIAFSAVSSGTSAIVMGHALAFIPQPVAGAMVLIDGINSAISLVQVLDNACLAFIELKTINTATTYQGQLIFASG